MNRITYYNLIEHGIQSLLDDRFGQIARLDPPHYLSLIIGKESCSEMSDEELVSVVESLRSEGYLEDRKSMIPY
ncbi:hypothetical protein [Vibrio fluminensis]|uniref:hypothetical protein n=1 Tax=Vibrio fluminensis TaxID=2783614 RepID=UPI0018886324|nr:hypothetical protein [Vibrio fluminensis]